MLCRFHVSLTILVLLSAATAERMFRVPLYQAAPAFYLGPLALGKPAPQLLSVLFDTGSSDVWALSTQCTSVACQQRASELYNRSASTSASVISRGDHKVCYSWYVAGCS